MKLKVKNQNGNKENYLKQENQQNQDRVSDILKTIFLNYESVTYWCNLRLEGY
jgi:hypothetical protein